MPFLIIQQCDLLLNNLSEAFNNTILVARKKPIIALFEWIRSYVMARFVTQQQKLAKYSGQIMRKPMKMLNRELSLVETRVQSTLLIK